MSRAFYSGILYVPAASFPSSPTKGTTVVLSTDGHLYTYDGSTWVDNGASSSGGSGLTNLDGGTPSSLYGGVIAIDGGTP